MKQVVLFWFFLCMGVSGYAQQIAKSGGTSNSTFLLGNTAYARKSQMLYPASVLSNVRSGKIVRLYFKYGSTGTANAQTLSHFRLKLGQTDAINYSSGSASFITDLVSVKHDTSFVIPSGSNGTWFPIELDSAFTYDSTKTLIVQVSFSASLVANWGTNGTSNTGPKKIISPDTAATIGDGTSSTWQDMAFDLMVTGTGELVTSINSHPFPNPTQGFVAVPGIKPGQICLVANAEGKTFTLTSDPDGWLDVRHLKPGIYWLRAMGEKRSFTFLKQ